VVAVLILQNPPTHRRGVGEGYDTRERGFRVLLSHVSTGKVSLLSRLRPVSKKRSGNRLPQEAADGFSMTMIFLEVHRTAY